VAILLAVMGTWLIKHGLELNSSLYLELLRELGSAALTAAVIDVLVLYYVDRFKAGIAAPFIEAANREQESKERFSQILDDVRKMVDKINEESFRITVQTDLDLIKLDLEAIHFAVDPAHREIVDAMKKDSSGSTG
jgi:hypothetical protein